MGGHSEPAPTLARRPRESHRRPAAQSSLLPSRLSRPTLQSITLVSAMASDDTNDLLSLLPTTPYTLAYALPLFVISILLTFAGCFFTLDRTRSFTPAPHVQPSPRSGQSLFSRLQHLYLGGGIGGLCAGYAFGGMYSATDNLDDQH
jgi:hypothetical protein